MMPQTLGTPNLLHAEGRAIAQANGDYSVANVYDNVTIETAQLQMDEKVVQQLLQASLRPNMEELFTIVTDPAQLISAMYPAISQDRTPHFYSAYVEQRFGMASVNSELQRAANETGLVLVRARTGLGKTREIAELLKVLLGNGWVAYIYKVSGYPLKLPKFTSLGGVKKVVLVVDGLEAASPDRKQAAEWMKQINHMFSLGRLPSDLRVILACRSEPQLTIELSELIEAPGTTVLLPEFTTEGLKAILSCANNHLNLGLSEIDMAEIVLESDGTPATLIETVELTHKSNARVSLHTWREMRRQDWRERFPQVHSQNPDAAVVLSILELLQSAGITATPQDVAWMARTIGAARPETAIQDLINHRIIGTSSQELRVFGVAQLRAGLEEIGTTRLALNLNWPLLARMIEARDDRSSRDRDFKSIILTLAAAGDLPLAIEASDRALENSLHPGELYFTRGLLKLLIGHLESAKEDLMQARNRDEINPEIHFVTGLAEMMCHQDGKAETSLGRAIAIDPGRQEFRLAHAILLCRSDQTDQAESELTNAVHAGVGVAEIYILRGSLFLKKNNAAAAAGDFSEAIRLGRNDALAYLLRGVALQHADAATAESDLSFALEKDRNVALAYLLRAGVRALRGNHIQAEQDYSSAIALGNANKDAFFARAIERLQLGRHGGAEEDLTFVLSQSPANAAAYILRASSRVGLKKTRAAEVDLGDAIKYSQCDDGTRAAILRFRASVRWDLGDIPGANEDLKQAAKLHKPPETWLSKVLTKLRL